MAQPTPDQHIAAARRRLGHLAGLEAGTAKAEQAILQHARERLDTVEAELEQVRRHAAVKDRAATRYLELTEERGRLLEVIQRANDALGQGHPQDSPQEEVA